MNISDLVIFELVVKTGSFSKAAQQGYLTPPAIMYRINELEKSLGIQLFNRTSHGVTLTPAGKTLHAHAQSLIKDSDRLTRQVRQVAKHQSQTIRIGSSLLNPASKLMNLWNRVLKAAPKFRLQFSPLETLSYPFPEMYEHLGEEVDLLYGPYGYTANTYHVNFYPFTKYHFSITMHADDPLAARSKIELSDLANGTLTLGPYGYVRAVDQIYDRINHDHLKIQTNETDVHYTIDTFNQFMLNGQYFLTLDCWQDVLPGLVSRPLDIPLSIPYGFIAPNHPSSEMSAFIKVLLDVTTKSENRG